MLARIINNTDIILDNITVPEEDLVMDRFTVVVNNFFVNPDSGGFNGIYRRYDRQKRRLARPFLGELRALCRKENIPLVVHDERPHWPYEIINEQQIDHDFLPGIKLEKYQVDAIKLGCRVECCIFDILQGGGKTEVMAGLCKAIKCPTVILADQRIVIDQIKKRLELRDVIDEVGLFYAGQTPSGQMIVAGSVQSLQIPSRVPQQPQESDSYHKAKEYVMAHRDEFDIDYGDRMAVENAVNGLADKIHRGALRKYESTLKGFRKRKMRAKEFQDIVKKAEMIIVDECDLASSAQFRYVFRYLFRGRRRYGFSGTPFDPAKPVATLFVQEHLGSVLMSVGRSELEKLGRIIPVTYTMFALGNTPRESSTFDIAVKEKLVENEQLHKIIAATCAHYSSDKFLILVDRDALGYKLAEMIPGSVFIHGKTPKRRRDDVLRAFERRDLRVVIGGKIVRRGLDLKGGCDCLWIATGGNLTSTFKQQLGRAFRVNERGYARVFDVMFLNNKHLYKHSRTRLRAIVDMGYKTRVVYTNGQQVDGKRFLITGYRQPKARTQIGQRIKPDQDGSGQDGSGQDGSGQDGSGGREPSLFD